MNDPSVTIYTVLGQLIEDLQFENEHGPSTTRDVLVDTVFAVAKRALGVGVLAEVIRMDDAGQYMASCRRNPDKIVLRLRVPTKEGVEEGPKEWTRPV